MIERHIIIALITSTEFCQNIQDIWNVQYLESDSAKRIALWVWEYFEKYNKAPGKELESIYYSKLQEGKIPEKIAEEIEQDILPGLSAEYESGVVKDIDFILEQTQKYFGRRHLILHIDEIQGLLEKAELDKANDLALGFKDITLSVNKIDNFIQTTDEIRKKDKKKQRKLMSPWLIEGQTTIIYANAGCGKTLLAVLIAYMLGLRHYDTDDCEIGEWFVHEPTGTLYIDGEMGEKQMVERVNQYEWLGKQKASLKMQLFSIPEYQLETQDSFYLSERKNQKKIIDWLKEHPDYKLVVLDSISTLFGLKEENDNSEWNNKVSPLLRDLRALNVACLILHHSGKDKKRGLRGASSMEAMAQNIFKLSSHPNKNLDDGEAWFVLTKDKLRAAGKSFKTFALRFFQNEQQTETRWELTKIDE